MKKIKEILPVKLGYEEVLIGKRHCYRNVKTGFIMQEENDRIPDDNIEDLLINIVKLIKIDGYAIIVNGFDTDVLGRGNLHYTLNEIKQKDMENIYKRIKEDNVKIVYWRDSSRSMYEQYTDVQFLQLYKDANIFMMLCKLYSDCLEQKALNAYNNKDVQTLRNSYFGAPIDDESVNSLNIQMKNIFNLTDEELENYKEKYRACLSL